jgi:hypothetical protein
MMKHFPAQITPAEFPELKKLVWNRDPHRPIPADEVFNLYERNWRFVEPEELTPKETLLIRELTTEHGHGFNLM